MPKISKNSEFGRSMIEMLGVLAIIGVLSVGGIAGYSKAMMKYKTNKTIDQISQIMQGIRTAYGSQKSYESISTGTLKKLHVIPDEMWDGNNIKNAFDGEVLLTAHRKKTGSTNDAVMLQFRDLPREACIEVATYDWGSGSSSGLIGLGVSDVYCGVAHDSYIGCNGYDNPNGIYACPKGSVYGIPLNVAVASENCSDSGLVSFKFY